MPVEQQLSIVTILSAELLAISARSNAKIKGIGVNGKSQKIGQFAEYTVLSLHYSNDNLANLAETFSIFQNFEKVSGLKVYLD